MACITRQRVGKYVYVYESHSFRNEEGKPRNKKVKIGKVDPKTGQVVFTKEYRFYRNIAEKNPCVFIDCCLSFRKRYVRFLYPYPRRMILETTTLKRSIAALV